MKFLVDMNLSPRWLARLAQAGFEAVHWSMIGPPNAADEQIMSHAVANDFVVLTHDLDFGAILAVTHGEKPSVVRIRSDDVSPDDHWGSGCCRAEANGVRAFGRRVVEHRCESHALARVAAQRQILIVRKRAALVTVTAAEANWQFSGGAARGGAGQERARHVAWQAGCDHRPGAPIHRPGA